MKARINEALLVPPSDWIGNMLRVSAEITIEFITKIRFRRRGKCWQIIKNVVSGRRTLKEKVWASSKEINYMIHTEGGGGALDCSSTSINA
jgi:hypothetical protein